MIVKKLSDNSIQVTINSNLYHSEIIHKCLYWYSNKFNINIELIGDHFEITMVSISQDLNIKDIEADLRRDLIDFKTRDIISKETSNIREMLIAKAFANDDEFDEQPPGDISDPVGFNPYD